MRNPAPLGLRGVRAGVLGTCALLLAATAHLLGGGSLPSLPMLFAAGLPTGCAAVVLARRTRGLPSLLAFLAIGQVALHEAFMTSTASMPCATTHAGHTGQAGHAIAPPGCTTAMSMVHGDAPSTLMLALHVVAVLATALLLAHGERLGLRICAWLRPRLSAPSVRVPVHTAVRTAFRVGQVVPQRRIAADITRRGPPRAPAVLPSFA